MRTYLLVLLFQTRCSCVQEIFSRFIISFPDEDKDIHGYSCFTTMEPTFMIFFIKRYSLVLSEIKKIHVLDFFCCELHHILSSSYKYFCWNKMMNKIKLKKRIRTFLQKYSFVSQNLGCLSVSRLLVSQIIIWLYSFPNNYINLLKNI